jgi:osomolarity two-component system sensor histidine kinase NIK1
MDEDQTLAAVAAIVKGLAVSQIDSYPGHIGTNTNVKLPGPETAAKEELERELSALVVRVQQLEARASAANAPNYPDTPNETTESPPFDDDSRPSARSRFSGLSSSRNGHTEERLVKAAPLTDAALEGLQEHINDQSILLDNQRQELTNVNAQLVEQKKLQEKALQMIEIERVSTLERELWKHQKANEAFQKALREIGEIVTAVARGDLSKKVRMNTVEMDPEITTFKRTINTMMDQLQVFASEVSRVAREVGTDGVLGGQAKIEGVDGTWKELTDNGIILRTDLREKYY